MTENKMKWQSISCQISLQVKCVTPIRVAWSDIVTLLSLQVTSLLWIEMIGPWPKPSTNELAGWFILAISLVNHGLGLLLLLTINVYFSVTLLQIFHTSDISKCEGKHETKKQSNSSTDLIFSNSEISWQFQEANMLPKSIHNKTDTFTWYLPYSDLWSLYTGTLWCFYGQI